MSTTDWRNAVRVGPDEVTHSCICDEMPGMGSSIRVVGAQGCPLHALEVYQEYLRDIVGHGPSDDAITAAQRLQDLVEIEKRAQADTGDF